MRVGYREKFQTVPPGDGDQETRVSSKAPTLRQIQAAAWQERQVLAFEADTARQTFGYLTQSANICAQQAAGVETLGN